MSILLLWPVPLLMVALGLIGGNWYWHLPTLLGGVHWGLDGVAQRLLLAIGLVWLVSLLVGRARYQQPRLWPWLLLAQLASLLLPLALDLMSFYLAFVALGLSLYGVIRLCGGSRCSGVGRRYLVLMLVADGLVLEASLPLVAASHGQLLLAPLSAQLSQHPGAGLMLALGFALKAGALLGHGWLTALARRLPAPPLLLVSGLLLAAGLGGWLRLPGLIQGWAGLVIHILALLALLATVGGALNCRQRRPAQGWVVVSQVALLMVLMTSAPQSDPALRLTSAAWLITQQPLLWLLACLPAASGGRRLLWWLAALPWWALLPMLASGEPWLLLPTLLVSVAAAHAAAIGSPDDSLDRRQPARVLLVTMAVAVAGQLAIVTPWLATQRGLTHLLGVGALWWLLAITAAAMVHRYGPRQWPKPLPEGDWLKVLVPPLLVAWDHMLKALASLDQPPAITLGRRHWPRRLLAKAAQLESGLTGGVLASVALLLVLIALAIGWG
ncbi:MAG: hypothetical protein II007_00525 [Gammaproteobacteria bacterium]|nr:hypothetical protein [Gammaproteobacteria bacterium]